MRADFPILRQPSNGHRLVYLDSAATSQKPQAVIDAISAYYGGLNANVHRGGYDLAIRATDAYEEARASLAAFTGAWDPSGVIFVRGTTEGINLIASSLGALKLKRGDTIVVTAMEHHSNLIPWQLVAQARGAEIVMVELTADGRIDLADFRRALERSPRIVAFTHVSNALGTINPVAELVAAGARRGGGRGGGRRAERAAPAGGRAGAGLRLLRPVRPQDARADGDRRGHREDPSCSTRCRRTTAAAR